MPAFLYGPSSAYHCAGPYQNGSLNHNFGLQPESNQNPPCASKKFFKFLTSIPQHHIWTSRPDTDADGYPMFPPAHFRSQPPSRRSFFHLLSGRNLPASGACMDGMSAKDRRKTPALRPRLLRSYVSAAFFSERKRVRRGYIIHAGSTPPLDISPLRR